MSNASDSRVASDTPVDVDKRSLYGEWLRNSRWRDALARRATHKALNMPEDDMQIHASHGLDWKGLAVIVAGLVLAGLGGGYVVSSQSQQTTQQAAPTEAAEIDPQAFEVRFYDAEGNLVPVPHVSTRQASE